MGRYTVIHQVTVSLYLLIFAMVIVAAEFKVEKVYVTFPFLALYPGRGTFYILYALILGLHATIIIHPRLI